MSTTRRITWAGLLTATLLIYPATAGSLETGDSRRPLSGQPQPEPTAGSVIAVSFNPSVQLIVQEGESLVDLLGRLELEIEEISLGQYLAEVEVEGRLFGIEIRNSDGSELNRLSARKDDPSLPDIRLELERPGLGARIRFPDVIPTGGVLAVAINDQPVVVDTALYTDPESLVQEVAWRLMAQGFQGFVSGLDLVVLSADDDDGAEVESVSVRSTDPALVRWEVDLKPLPVAF